MKKHASKKLAAAAAFAVSVAGAQAALVEGRTTTGQPYMVGGVGVEEVDMMRQHAPAFSLQVITAARTGAYVADTHVRIVGPGNSVVLDTVIAAPWLLVDLPTGRYTLLATNAGKTVERQLNVVAGRPQRVVLHYDVPVDNEPAGAQAASPDTSPSRMPQ